MNFADNQNLQQNVTLGLLLEYTDQHLLPRIEDLIDRKLEEKLESKLEEKLESKLEEKLDAKLDKKLEIRFNEFEKKLETKFVTKAYLDDKLADQAVEIIKRVERMFVRDNNFKQRVTTILRRHNLLTSEDESFFEALSI